MIIKVLFLKREGIVFKARWFVWPDINTDVVTIIFAWNDGRACVYIGPYKPSRFKNNTFILYVTSYGWVTFKKSDDQTDLYDGKLTN